MEPVVSEPEFNSFDAIDDFIADKRGVMIDLNTERIQMSREAVQGIERLQMKFNEEQQELSDLFNEACNDIVTAHLVAARMSADFTADMIMDEFSIPEVEAASDNDEDE